MNKIYKLVWNKARNMYVAVSEITKSHRKETTRQKERLALAVAVSLCAFFGGWLFLMQLIPPIPQETRW